MMTVERQVREQEYGIDHPWDTFDHWHEIDHAVKHIKWPCQMPLRCLWRFTRKTGSVLTQSGIISESTLGAEE